MSFRRNVSYLKIERGDSGWIVWYLRHDGRLGEWIEYPKVFSFGEDIDSMDDVFGAVIREIWERMGPRSKSERDGGRKIDNKEVGAEAADRERCFTYD
jgi:hypothetical protein